MVGSDQDLSEPDELEKQYEALSLAATIAAHWANGGRSVPVERSNGSGSGSPARMQGTSEITSRQSKTKVRGFVHVPLRDTYHMPSLPCKTVQDRARPYTIRPIMGCEEETARQR
jgi:hypothetical protein